jgi:hypothetical protein
MLSTFEFPFDKYANQLTALNAPKSAIDAIHKVFANNEAMFSVTNSIEKLFQQFGNRIQL